MLPTGSHDLGGTKAPIESLALRPDASAEARKNPTTDTTEPQDDVTMNRIDMPNASHTVQQSSIDVMDGIAVESTTETTTAETTLAKSHTNQHNQTDEATSHTTITTLNEQGVPLDQPPPPRTNWEEPAPLDSSAVAVVTHTNNTVEILTSQNAGMHETLLPAKAPNTNGNAETDSLSAILAMPRPTSVVQDPELAKARAPLSDRYGPFLTETDSCLADARQRLRKALQQTRQLRDAFTKRVYQKYRVCLQPPVSLDDTLRQIANDPKRHFQRLAQETAAIREEKEMEKKETAKLNAELAATGSSATATTLVVDAADQLLYFTAGLNLIVLPEDNRNSIDSAMMNELSGQQRVKNISIAAATAGEIMLDRARKGAAMRMERIRRKQLALLSGDTAADSQHLQYSRLALLHASRNPADGLLLPPKKKQKTEVPLTTAIAKGSRVRTQGSPSTTSLLSMAPSSDSNAPSSAAMAALVARSNAIPKTTQQRLKHPHPDSLGGRRRANNVPKKDGTSEPFLQAYLALTLPPLPATKERLERKPVPVSTREEASAPRAQEVVTTVLRQFTDNSEHSLTKIQLLYEFRQQNPVREEYGRLADDTLGFGPSESCAPWTSVAPTTDGIGLSMSATAAPNPAPLATGEEPSSNLPIDPVLAFSVLHAVGLIRPKASSQGKEATGLLLEIDEASPVWSDKLKSLRKTILASDDTVTSIMLGLERRKAETVSTEPVESILGGGESPMDTNDNAGTKGSCEETTKVNSAGEDDLVENGEQDNGKASSIPSPIAGTTGKRKYSDPTTSKPRRKRKYSDPGRLSGVEENGSVASVSLGSSQQGASGQLGYNGFGMGQLHSSQHPAGELALRTVQGYDIASLVHAQGPGIACMPTGMIGYVLPDGGSGAMFPSDHVPVIIGASGYTQTPPYPHASAVTFGPPQLIGPPYPTTANGHTFVGDQNQLAANKPPSTAEEVDNNGRTSASTMPASVTAGSNVEHMLVANTQTHGSSGGMKFFEPSKPDELPLKCAQEIKSGMFHAVVASLERQDSKKAALAFLVAAGASVPIPKALISGAVKEKLSAPGFKNVVNGGTLTVPREVVVAAISVWLWANHESNFQAAFEKSGRTDVDPDCKWLIQAAVDTAVRALALDIAESVAQGVGPFAESSANRPQNVAKNGPTDDAPEFSKSLEIHTAAVVNRALATEFSVDERLNSGIPVFQQLVEVLDEARLCALRAKAQERTMLASLIAQKGTMNDSFSNAYVAAMARAGDALGHDSLFDLVQDSDASVASMMPYDILMGDDDQWEDPCKPNGGFTEGLMGDDLMRRAHARAMIQKSLRKLQDRNHIRGGTSNFGPYVDSGSSDSPNAASVASAETGGASPRSNKRRASSSAEPSSQVGTGSARAKSWAVYDPTHVSPPLVWNPEHSENTPYGLHRVGERVRSLSLSMSARSGEPRSLKKTNRSASLAAAPPVIPAAQKVRIEEGIPKSTREIDWADIAGIFQSVELPRKSPPSKATEKADSDAPTNKTIFAPYCRRAEDVVKRDAESDTEEDLSEEKYLAGHQIVLDRMKAKVAAFLEARKKQQERRKNKNNSK